MIIKTMNRAILHILAFLLMMIPLLCGFACVGMGVWGQDLVDYNSFGNAFLSVLFLTMGQTNTPDMMKVNQFWTVVFTTFFYIIVLYLFSFTFIAIYSDAYR
jgi:hypothetical protein